MLGRTREPIDERLAGLLEASGANLRRAAITLREVVAECPERSQLARDLVALEHEGDRITRDIIHRLNGADCRAPFDSADGYTLATALDDIVDHAEECADRIGLYRIEAPMEQATALADVLVGATEQVARALHALASGGELAPALVEVQRLENEGDRISRDAVASLFADGIDPMVVIRWKDVFGSLEAAVDACETVAHVLEGIALKWRPSGLGPDR